VTVPGTVTVNGYVAAPLIWSVSAKVCVMGLTGVVGIDGVELLLPQAVETMSMATASSLERPDRCMNTPERVGSIAGRREALPARPNRID